MQMSDEILVLSVKEQKLKHWSGCTCTHKRVPFLSTPGCLFFLFFLGSNSLQACVPYLCKQTTGKSKDMAPPNLCVQACHTKLFKQRRGPWALPPHTHTHTQRFPTSGGVYAKNGICTTWCGRLSRAAILTYRTTKSTQTNRELVYVCRKWQIPLMFFTTSTKLPVANVHWCAYYTGLPALYPSTCIKFYFTTFMQLCV